MSSCSGVISDESTSGVVVGTALLPLGRPLPLQFFLFGDITHQSLVGFGDHFFDLLGSLVSSRISC